MERKVCRATSQVYLTQSPREELLLFLSAQAFLEKQLMGLYKRLYGQSCHRTFEIVEFDLMNCDTALREWRDHLPEDLQWNDSDGSPCNMLHVRLRAKYWRIRYLMYRPFLSFALNIQPYYDINCTVEKAAVSICGITKLPTEVFVYNAIAAMDKQRVMDGCRFCVQAAFESLTAFGQVTPDLLVADLQSTAYM